MGQSMHRISVSIEGSRLAHKYMNLRSLCSSYDVEATYRGTLLIAPLSQDQHMALDICYCRVLRGGCFS